MTSDRRKSWFAVRRSGLGWGLPCCWQGWLVLAVYVVLIICGALLLSTDAHPRAYTIYSGVLSLLLIAVYMIKGQRLH